MGSFRLHSFFAGLRPTTLGVYLAKLYTLCLVAMLGGLLSILYLFETVELIRRAANKADIPLSILLQMGLFKLPESGQVILPFAVLFSALYTFWLLARRQELVVLRAAGLSVWRFLAPLMAVAFAAGLLHMTIINPIGALMIARFETLESSVLGRAQKIVSLSEQGLWLRQDSTEGPVILHAQKVQMPAWILNGVMALYFDQQGNFLKRLDAQNAVLENNAWVFSSPILNEGRAPPQILARETLPTTLSLKDIEDSFSSAEETPFWALPSYIRTMRATGFDARALEIHFQSLLAQPLLFAAMVILAATVSLRPARLQQTPMMIIWGVVFGFAMFFMASVLKALGASDQIPVLIAAWFPPLIALSLAISVIITTEDG